MKRADFVYVTFIASTPERVWDALFDGEMTRQYWNHLNVSDWKVGSGWEHQRLDEQKTVDITGTVLESVPPTRLVISWASPKEIQDSTKVSRVTFTIEPHAEGIVRLTLVHDELEEGSKMASGIAKGWPVVLSGLKTLLETGKALPMFQPQKQEVRV
jgi:uncharacterized protein YndB with AHSA1/START domain